MNSKCFIVGIARVPLILLIGKSKADTLYLIKWGAVLALSTLNIGILTVCGVTPIKLRDPKYWVGFRIGACIYILYHPSSRFRRTDFPCAS